MANCIVSYFFGPSAKSLQTELLPPQSMQVRGQNIQVYFIVAFLLVVELTNSIICCKFFLLF